MYRGFSLSMHSVGSMEGGFLPNRVLIFCSYFILDIVQIFIGSHVFFELKIQIKSEALSNHYSSHLKLMFHTSVFPHIIPLKCQNLLYLHAKEVKLLCIPETLCDQISRKPPMHLSPVNFAFWVLFTVIK